MTYCDFSCQSHGKWLLAGEHAVLRGNPVIVFPLLNKKVTLNFWQQDKEAHAEFSGEFAAAAHLLFWSTLERGLEIVGHSLSEINGQFSMTNEIPIGSGLGASAALCVAIGKWFVWKKWVKENDLFEFSRQLENLFHGQSSGIDILGATHSHGILYTPGKSTQEIKMSWKPNWYLSDTQQLGVTSHCVNKVNDLLNKNPKLGQRIDTAMKESVIMASTALQQDEVTGLPLLAQAINQAKLCFTQWGLASGKVEHHINQLLAAGAIAAKPTGSGDGGYVLSLWPDKVPCSLGLELIAV